MLRTGRVVLGEGKLSPRLKNEWLSTSLRKHHMRSILGVSTDARTQYCCRASVMTLRDTRVCEACPSQAQGRLPCGRLPRLALAGSVTANVKIPKRAKIKIPTFVRWLHLRHNGLVSQSVEEEATDAGSGGAVHD